MGIQNAYRDAVWRTMSVPRCILGCGPSASFNREPEACAGPQFVYFPAHASGSRLNKHVLLRCPRPP